MNGVQLLKLLRIAAGTPFVLVAFAGVLPFAVLGIAILFLADTAVTIGGYPPPESLERFRRWVRGDCNCSPPVDISNSIDNGPYVEDDSKND